jgi:hypothetical protein
MMKAPLGLGWMHEAIHRGAEPNTGHIAAGTTFGTLKAWMGHTHFLTRRLDRIRTEMRSLVLAYNMKRLMNIMGVEGGMAALKADPALRFGAPSPQQARSECRNLIRPQPETRLYTAWADRCLF